MILILLLVIFNLTGCASVYLFPMEKTDIFSLEKGDKVQKVNGNLIEVEKNGWYLSDNYVKKAMKARLK